MSTQVNQYIGYGYMLPYKVAKAALLEISGAKDDWDDVFQDIMDKYEDSAFKSEITEVNGCSLIMDGCNCKFIFFGKVFYKTSDYEYAPTTDMMEVWEKATFDVRANIDVELTKLFGGSFGKSASVYLITLYR